MSQQDVADRLNVARQSVSRWETDKSYPDLAEFDTAGSDCTIFRWMNCLELRETEAYSRIGADENPTEENAIGGREFAERAGVGMEMSNA